MLQPKQTKFKKVQKGKNRGFSNKCTNILFGKFALKAISRGRITSRQIESARRSMSRYVKKEGKIWIRIFPNKPITKKPLEVRMGKGKGNVEYWVTLIKPGRILYEIDGIKQEIAFKALKLASSKLPVKTILIKKMVLL
ncbi:50S ribosomal protein L16 [Candidatus Annandia adelgestsuga]|uniref:Large ribosomal subunit protein uL16 n=1 Tax=Candidatus Annandia adelgestsuga TaxID=1302411 RepID=A0A3Q9CM39_9ENTR|nr:50S ribosomal protein L16 [Candidatus Annandia adelgestsuga]AZP36215.1 50S ribosomal protein L16 [Candidatus Annandia adelgestsuga]